MKQLLEFIPILLFFIAYKMSDIYLATKVLMIATCIQMAILYKMDGKLEFMQKLTLVLIIGFGGLTLILQDERFIKWKPTVLYLAMAFAMAFSLWIIKKNVIKLLLSSKIELPDRVWYHLAITWIIYSLFMASLNAYMVLYFSTEAWVSFKLWGFIFPVIFIVGQGFYISKYLKMDQNESSK